MDLTPERTILLAAHLASEANISGLRTLLALQPAVLHPTLVLDLLLHFLPESTPPQSYAQLLKDIVYNRILDPTHQDLDTSFVASITEASASRTLESLNFSSERNRSTEERDLLTPWLHSRAQSIDRETGSISLIDELVSQFIESSPDLYSWYMGTISVLNRFIYQGGEINATYNLQEFENLSTQEAIRLLVSDVKEDALGHGLELVTQYIGYRRPKRLAEGRTDPWKYLFGWIEDLSKERFGLIWRIVRDWEGPEEEVRPEYFRTLLTACYTCQRTDEETVQQMQDVVHRVAEAVGIKLVFVGADDAHALVERFMAGRGSIRNIFASQDFEEDAGELIAPTSASLKLLDLLIVSVRMLALFPLQLTVREVMRMRFSGSREDQLGLLKRALQVDNKQRNDQAYEGLRHACKFLQSESKVLGNITQEDFEVEILRAMLSATKFLAVTSAYSPSRRSRGTPVAETLLPLPTVEKTIIHSVLDFYDTATNGNRTRGGMKNASNALAIIYPTHSNTLPLRRLSMLISATHSLSEYSLTLTPGVPLKPVQIRLYHDPPDLISRVLQSNPKAYLQLDTLVKVAQELVCGVSRSEGEPSDLEMALVKSRVTGMCVESALAEDDFETAYSYVMSKLVPGHKKSRLSDSTAMVGNTADTAWQAALQAGRYRSPAMLAESMEGVATSKGIDQIQKRMEVLSHALMICPAEAMADILGTWKRCEEELEGLLEQEVREERAHAGKLTSWVGGLAMPLGGSNSTGATSRGDGFLTKGPMNLLSVASSAGSLAKSLGSTAFPLRAATPSGRESQDGSQRDSGEYDREDGERSRKRDVLSGMVTSGLASGLGWVLGAKPEDLNQGGGARY